MKVLRIYDHQGILRKEFNLYVVGNDFKWEASYPEPVWLGTISLEELGEVPVAERTPEAEAVEPEPEDTRQREKDMRQAAVEAGYLELEVKEEEPERVLTAEDVVEAAPFCFSLKEVKHEPEKVHGKRSRVKRSASPASLKSTKRLHQDDPGGDSTKGN